MNRKNNKENLRTIVLNAPKIKLKLNNQPINYPFIETQRSPKINELYQKIQQSIECNTDAIQQKEQNHNDKISYHQQKIREKLRKQTRTPTIPTQESKDSFNIWNDNEQLNGNLIDNYTRRSQLYENNLKSTQSQEEFTENLLKLLGMNLKVKNLGKNLIQDQMKQQKNYFIPPQNMWKFNRKKGCSYNNTLQNSTQYSQLQNSKIRLNSQDSNNQYLNLKLLNSPDILKMKFMKIQLK